MLGISVPAAIGHLHCLWWWALDYAEDGDLSVFDAEDIADAAMWDGDPQAFVDALIACGPSGRAGFVERTPDGGLRLHDWEEYAGRLIASRQANARAGAKGNHERWHVRKGIVDPNCPYCRQGSVGDRGAIGARSGGESGSDRDPNRVSSHHTVPNPTQPKDAADDDARAREDDAQGAAPEPPRADGAVPLGPRIGNEVVEAPEDLRPIDQAYFAATGRTLQPGRDRLLARKALQKATVDQIIRAIERGKARWKPAYDGDKIRGFGYFMPIIDEIVAEDAAAAAGRQQVRTPAQAPQKARDLSFLDQQGA